MVYLLGSFMSWRQVAYACAIIPMLNILVALFVSYLEQFVFFLSNNFESKI